MPVGGGLLAGRGCLEGRGADCGERTVDLLSACGGQGTTAGEPAVGVDADMALTGVHPYEGVVGQIVGAEDMDTHRHPTCPNGGPMVSVQSCNHTYGSLVERFT